MSEKTKKMSTKKKAKKSSKKSKTQEDSSQKKGTKKKSRKSSSSKRVKKKTSTSKQPPGSPKPKTQATSIQRDLIREKIRKRRIKVRNMKKSPSKRRTRRKRRGKKSLGWSGGYSKFLETLVLPPQKYKKEKSILEMEQKMKKEIERKRKMMEPESKGSKIRISEDSAVTIGSIPQFVYPTTGPAPSSSNDSSPETIPMRVTITEKRKNSPVSSLHKIDQSEFFRSQEPPQSSELEENQVGSTIPIADPSSSMKSLKSTLNLTSHHEGDGFDDPPNPLSSTNDPKFEFLAKRNTEESHIHSHRYDSPSNDDDQKPEETVIQNQSFEEDLHEEMIKLKRRKNQKLTIDEAGKKNILELEMKTRDAEVQVNTITPPVLKTSFEDDHFNLEGWMKSVDISKARKSRNLGSVRMSQERFDRISTVQGLSEENFPATESSTRTSRVHFSPRLSSEKMTRISQLIEENDSIQLHEKAKEEEEKIRKNLEFQIFQDKTRKRKKRKRNQQKKKRKKSMVSSVFKQKEMNQLGKKLLVWKERLGGFELPKSSYKTKNYVFYPKAEKAKEVTKKEVDPEHQEEINDLVFRIIEGVENHSNSKLITSDSYSISSSEENGEENEGEEQESEVKKDEVLKQKIDSPGEKLEIWRKKLLGFQETGNWVGGDQGS